VHYIPTDKTNVSIHIHIRRMRILASFVTSLLYSMMQCLNNINNIHAAIDY